MIVRSFVAAAVASLLMLSPASAESMTTLPSAYSVKETMDRLAKALEEKGIKVVARVDHAAAAKAAGMELAPTEVLIFGNPKLGTPLMQANPAIGLDLPMKVVAWQGKDGKVMIGYAPPADLKARYKISGKDEVFETMTKALGAFTKGAGTK